MQPASIVITIIMDLSFFYWDKQDPDECLTQAFTTYETSPTRSIVITAVEKAFSHPLDTQDAKDAFIQRLEDIVLKNRLCKPEFLCKRVMLMF